MSSDILWSILVCTIPSRKEKCLKLLEWVEMQIQNRPIELLCLFDNYKMSVGQKRNRLLDMAQGRYLCWIDDDDTVSERYVEDIWYRLNADADGGNPADVYCFKQLCTHVEDGYEERCSYSLRYKYEQGRDYDIGTGDPLNSGWWRGLPAHTQVWRSEIAKQGRFPDSTFGEDVAWVRQVTSLAKTEVQIPETLYFYSFNPKTSETRG